MPLVLLLAIWLILELAVRAGLQWPLRTDFYSSIPRQTIRERQQQAAEFFAQIKTGTPAVQRFER